jgi:hypothetical protein
MSLMVARGYKSAYVVNPKRGHREPFVVIIPFIDHRDGHYVRPNKVALKYPNFKKDVDPYAHVKMFNSPVK